MSDMRRERDAARRERDAARRRIDELEAENREHRRTITLMQQMHGEVPVEWVNAMHLLRDVAHGGWRRIPTGVPTTPDSQPPVYSATAYNRLREERRWMAQNLVPRARNITSAVSLWVDGETRKEHAGGQAT